MASMDCNLSFFETRVLSELRQIKTLLKKALLRNTQTIYAAETQVIEGANIMSMLAAGFIRVNGDRITELLIDEARWTIDKVTGQCLGRVQREHTTDYRYAPNYSLAVRCKPFKQFAKLAGLDSKDLKHHMVSNHIKARQVTLLPDVGTGVHVYVIPLIDGSYTQRGTGNTVYGSRVNIT